MGMLVSPYRQAAPAESTDVSASGATTAPVPIVFVNRGSTTSVNLAAAIPWDAEVYDGSSVHSAGATTFTVPSTGLYRLSGAISTSGGGGAKARKNSAFLPGGFGLTHESSAPRWDSGASAPLLLTSGDTLDVLNDFITDTFGANGTAYTWFNLERLDANTRYAVVKKTTDQTLTAETAITFDDEIIDAGGPWHSKTVNNTRLTVPSGVTRVRITANVVTGNFSGSGHFEITKNGVKNVVGVPAEARNAGGNKLMNMFGAPISVTAGDYFEILATFTLSSTVNAESYTWFAIEEVPTAVKSCLVYNTTGYSLTATDLALTFPNEDHDPEGMHSTVTNTSRLTVPAGISYARVSFQIVGAGLDGDRIQAQVTKNGGAVVGTGTDAESGQGSLSHKVNGVSAWMPVTPGDYFEVWAQSPGAAVTTGAAWAAMECI